MAVLVSDSFNRANNTTLGSTDSYNGGTAKVWQYSNTPFGIDANQAYLTSGTNGIAYVDAGVSDCDVTVTLSTSHTYTYSCVSVRVQDASNQISLQYDGTSWYMYKQVSGSFTQLASAAFTATDGDIIKVRLNGTSISVFMNGSTAPLMSGTTASFQTVTNHGLQPANTNNRYDNFQVESLTTSPTTLTVSGTSDGNSNTTATPALHKQASGTASGTSFSTTDVSTHLIASGTSNGTSSASASVGIVVIESSGISDGTSTATASPAIRKQSSGGSDGSSSANATPVCRFVASGISVGSSWTLINLPRESGADDLYYYYSHENKKLVARN